MKFIIDRIEENFAICENLETKELVEININELPKKLKNGNVIVFKNNEYELDLNEEELRRKRIRERFNKLKNN